MTAPKHPESDNNVDATPAQVHIRHLFSATIGHDRCFECGADQADPIHIKPVETSAVIVGERAPGWDKFSLAFTRVQQAAYANSVSHGFYEDGKERNFGEAIALMHSELSEALEWARKNPEGKSDHIPEFTGVEEEFADVIIRIMDLAGHKSYRIAEAVIAKMRFNAARPFKHGKRF